MSDIDLAKLYASLRRHEEERLKPYDDATGRPLNTGDTLKGKLTIGVGRNLTDRGITMDESMLLMENDVTTAIKELDRAAETRTWWRTLPEPARRALVEMTFNLGISRLLGFERMLDALHDHDWVAAREHALDSKWADQVGERARTIAAQFMEA